MIMEEHPEGAIHIQAAQERPEGAIHIQDPSREKPRGCSRCAIWSIISAIGVVALLLVCWWMDVFSSDQHSPDSAGLTAAELRHRDTMNKLDGMLGDARERERKRNQESKAGKAPRHQSQAGKAPLKPGKVRTTPPTVTITSTSNVSGRGMVDDVIDIHLPTHLKTPKGNRKFPKGLMLSYGNDDSIDDILMKGFMDFSVQERKMWQRSGPATSNGMLKWLNDIRRETNKYAGSTVHLVYAVVSPTQQTTVKRNATGDCKKRWENNQHSRDEKFHRTSPPVQARILDNKFDVREGCHRTQRAIDLNLPLITALLFEDKNTRNKDHVRIVLHTCHIKDSDCVRGADFTASEYIKRFRKEYENYIKNLPGI